MDRHSMGVSAMVDRDFLDNKSFYLVECFVEIYGRVPDEREMERMEKDEEYRTDIIMRANWKVNMETMR